MHSDLHGMAGTIFHSSVRQGPGDGHAVVTGSFPPWLRGRLLRTAPAVFATEGWRAAHWFDALGQVYAFHIDGEQAVRWSQRLLDSEFRRQAEAGRVRLASFCAADQRHWLDRLLHPVPTGTDNANVSIWPAGADWMAMTETDRPLAIDPATLATRGPIGFDDTLPRGMWMTAHPQPDRRSGRLVNVGTVAGARPELVVFDHAPGGRQRRVVGRWRTPRLPYMHSFGLTDRAAVLIAHPFDVNPARFLFSSRFVDHYRWRPEQGTRLVVVQRADGSARVVETDAMFVFHVVNAFHDADTLVVDVLAYDDASVVTRQMRLDLLAAAVPGLTPRLRRLRIGASGVVAEPLCDTGFEFPVIHAALCRGLAYRHVWGAAVDGARGAVRSRIVRVDSGTGDVACFSESDFVYGEPVFVPRPGTANEGDGVLLTVGSSPSRQTTRLTALRALDLEPLACAEIDVPLPFGFHGAFQMQAQAEQIALAA